MMIDNGQAASPTIWRQLSKYQLILLGKIPEVSWWNDLPLGSLIRACGGILLHLLLPIIPYAIQKHIVLKVISGFQLLLLPPRSVIR